MVDPNDPGFVGTVLCEARSGLHDDGVLFRTMPKDNDKTVYVLKDLYTLFEGKRFRIETLLNCLQAPYVLGEFRAKVQLHSDYPKYVNLVNALGTLRLFLHHPYFNYVDLRGVIRTIHSDEYGRGIIDVKQRPILLIKNSK